MSEVSKSVKKNFSNSLLSQEVHNDFHTWNGGSKKPCTANNLIEFVQQLHSDNYEVSLRLNKIKRILAV